MTRTLLLLLTTVLIPSAVKAQSFGGAIALTHQHIIVGESANVAYPGEVYIFSSDNPAAEPTILSVNQELEQFGRAVAVSGETLFVGASDADQQRGAVYVFHYNGTWEQIARLTASDGSPGDQFGYAIAADKEKILIGAPGRMESAGAVYLITETEEGSFLESALLTAEDPGTEDRFGLTLTIKEQITLVGAPGQSDSRGAVYAFMQEADVWQQIGKMAPDFLTEGSRLGSAVMIHDGRFYAGAPMYEARQGIVLEYLWDAASAELRLQNQLRPLRQERGSQFGAALATSTQEIWVGANRSNQGKGVIYRFLPGEDGGQTRLRPDESLGRAAFGSQIAVLDDLAVIGAVRMDSRAGAAVVLKHREHEGAELVRHVADRIGAAVVLEHSEHDWSMESILINPPKGHAAINGQEIRCTDGMVSRWPCQDVDMTAFLPLPDMGGTRGSRLNDIWGWTDPETSREYALVGRSDGTSFVDVTVPESPRYLGDLPMTAGSVANVWRDIKVYANHAYVVADGAGQHGVQIFDLTQLREVDGEPVTFQETAYYDGIASAHNIVINEDTGFGFVVGASGGGETCGGGLHMLDLSDPVNVEFAGCFADESTGRRKTGYSHDAQCVIYSGPDLTYSGREICLGSNETALSIADVTEKDNPTAISMASYPKVAYTHQGWLTEDHRYFYMNDEGDEPQGLVEGTRTLIWDVSDLDDPVLVTEYIASTPNTDHNLYIKGNLMYQSNYGAGLRILDITNPKTPVEIGFFEPGPGSSSWSNYPYFKSGTLIVTSGSEGLLVLKKRTLDI